MVLQVIDKSLKVIGFNATFNPTFNAVYNSVINDMQDIDQVETCLYRGEVLTSVSSIQCTYVDLTNKCTDFVLEANNLSTNKTALIVIDQYINTHIEEAQSHFSDDYYSYNIVKHLSEALVLSEQIIDKNNVAVLIISASLNSSNSTANNTTPKKATISFDSGFESYNSLQGAACILLCSETFATANNSVLYASIDKVTTGTHKQIDSVIETALMGIDLTKINTLEVSAYADQHLKQLEQQALLSAYSNADPKENNTLLNTAISCQKSVLGENGCLSEVMALIHSVIALQQRYRPAIKDWHSPSKTRLSQWQNSPFYLFNQAAPVFPTPSGNTRINTVSLLTEDDVSHLVLTEINDGLVHQNGFNRCAEQSLFIIGAEDQQALLEKINKLAKSITVKTAVKSLAKQLYEDQKQATFTYKMVLIAESIEELNKEISLSVVGIKNAFNKSCDWKTPKGSYFTSQPEQNAKIAFLYPGIGATYVGLGRYLFHLFPEIYPSVVKLADNIGESLKDRLLNPRSVISPDFQTMKKLDLELRNSLANIAECGVGYACVFTKIFEQVFKLKADFASGYSMGEISMFAALGCWQNPGQMSARLANSDTFNHQLSSELRAIRKLWKMPDIEDGFFEKIWETYSIKGTVEQVNAEIGKDERVFVTIINTPDSLVIGGFPEDCLKVIKRLGVRAMPLNMANAIHSEPAYQEYDQMLELYSMQVTARIETKMISSSCYLPIPQLQKAIAVSIAKCLCEPVDFPRLINTLANKETKVFIEMGAGRSLCSWTDKILKNRALLNNSLANNCLPNKLHENHISVPVNAKGTDDQLTYARAMAKLVSFGADVDIDSFFNGSLITKVNTTVNQ
jgi:PfaB family protein